MLTLRIGYKTAGADAKPVLIYCGNDGAEAEAAVSKQQGKGFVRIVGSDNPFTYPVRLPDSPAELNARHNAGLQAQAEASARARELEIAKNRLPLLEQASKKATDALEAARTAIEKANGADEILAGPMPKAGDNTAADARRAAELAHRDGQIAQAKLPELAKAADAAAEALTASKNRIEELTEAKPLKTAEKTEKNTA